MNELDYQRLVIEAVRQHKGFGFKISNRFLIGLPDLLLHLPDVGTSMWEVKLGTKPKRPKYPVWIRPTTLQKKTLSDFAAAGGVCGVISFLKTVNEVWFGAFEYKALSESKHVVDDFTVPQDVYVLLQRGKREKIIVDQLRRAYDRR